MKTTIWVNDPKDSKPSVSLTLLLISFVLLLVASGLQMFKYVDSTSGLLDIFWGLLALYFGRRFTITGKDYSSDQVQSTVNKIEQETK